MFSTHATFFFSLFFLATLSLLSFGDAIKLLAFPNFQLVSSIYYSDTKFNFGHQTVVRVPFWPSNSKINISGYSTIKI